MWLALKPGLKSGRFEEFKQELAAKIKYAQEHLEEIIAEREEAEKKHGRITAELDEIKVSGLQFDIDTHNFRRKPLNTTSIFSL